TTAFKGIGLWSFLVVLALEPSGLNQSQVKISSTPVKVVATLKETAINHQGINGARFGYIVFGLLQHRKDMQIVGFFDSIDFDS
ncbi:MAG: hypothetical protein DRG73_09530, partial [Deltaproteobacteria bacterium]